MKQSPPLFLNHDLFSACAQGNEWRSVLRRLREFEREVMSGAATPALRLVPTEMELSDAASAHADVYPEDRPAAEHSASNGSNGSGDSHEP